MNELMEPRFGRADHWLRLVFALLYFGLIFYLVRILVGLVLVAQFILAAALGEPNDRLLRFTEDLHSFSYHALRFITWNTDDRPFPFSDWPSPQGTNKSVVDQ
ncbi:MAG: glucose-1-phosphate thymidylyltransferase [Acidiferrobacteraceae bacterium]|nr:glucose-1-phosphate thymidylyltransferase [Acidiferrobacteraceae bacterium]|tara:strand:- start:2152 stop:2460 length:309 start_codon:yes stop_codon:yes gene_type:complete